MDKIKELYEKVAASSELQAKLKDILTKANEKSEQDLNRVLLNFAAEAGYEITEKEVAEYIAQHAEKNQGELSDLELDSVAGGKNGADIAISVMTVGYGCAAISVGLEVIDGAGHCAAYYGKWE